MKAMVIAVAVLASTPALAQPLLLGDVIEAVRANHPLLEAARAITERADGQALAAEGAFDPRVRARATQMVAGYYDHTVVETDVRALMPQLGLVPFVGWRLGAGEQPIYDGKLRTLAQGELRAGVELPLLQGARIDRARGDRRKAALGRGVAAAELRQRELEVTRDAALAYYDWVGAAHRLTIRETQLGLARDRDEQLQRSVARGNRPPIDTVDNARLVAAREAIVIAAQRDLRRAALELSLHLRDANGRSIVAEPAWAPAIETAAPPPVRDGDLASVPRVAELSQRIAIASTELAVARNATLPTLNVSAFAARGLGAADPTLPDRSSTSFAVGATFELPIGMRTARGAVTAASAEQRRLEAERRFVVDRVATDVEVARVEVDAAERRAALAIRGAELAEQLAAAERTRFERGESNLLVVNLREETAAEAAAQAIDARIDVYRARVRLQATFGAPPR